MARNVPRHLKSAAIEGGDTKAEIMLCQIEATEEQTDAIKQLTRTIALAGIGEVGTINELRTISGEE